MTRLKMAALLLLPHRLGWALLSPSERRALIIGSQRVSATRTDFGHSTPAVYESLRACMAHRHPLSALEIGGSGVALEAMGVPRSIGLDPNPDSGAAIRRSWPCALSQRFDVIVFLNTVHHISDRVAAFAACRQSLHYGGIVFCSEPAYGLPHLRKRWRKISSRGYLNQMLVQWYSGTFSTHTMCSIGEFRALAKASGLRVVSVSFIECSRMAKYLPSWTHRWLAGRITVEMQRRGGTT